MNPMHRFILPVDELFVASSGMDYLPVALVEGVKETGLGVKTLTVGEDMLFVQAVKPKGMIDPVHQHDDHESLGYLLSGRMRLLIGDEEFLAEPGDCWRHPRGVPHSSESLEDCIQLEIKSPPRKTWYTADEIARGLDRQ